MRVRSHPGGAPDRGVPPGRRKPNHRQCAPHQPGSHSGLRKPEAESDFYFVEAADPETAVARIIELVKTRIPRRFGLDRIRDVQVLCPMNRGGVGEVSVPAPSTSSVRRH
jgi:hypothetical protein